MASSPLASLSFLVALSLLASTAAPYEGKKTHLHFYFQDKWLVPNATAVFVASLPEKPFVPFSFGDIGVLDNALTEGPDPSSRLVGRAQGLIAWVSKEDGASMTLMNLVFTGGEYNGSTIAVVGRVGPSGNAERSVVGGSGKFRLARGYAISKPFSAKNTTFVDEFDVYVTH